MCIIVFSYMQNLWRITITQPKKFISPLKCRKLLTQKLLKHDDRVVNPQGPNTRFHYFRRRELLRAADNSRLSDGDNILSETADCASEIVNRGYFIQGILRAREPDKTCQRIRTLFAKYEPVLSGSRSDSHAETVHSSSIENFIREYFPWLHF